MNKTSKLSRLMAIVLTLVMLLSIVPTTVFAEDATPIGNSETTVETETGESTVESETGTPADKQKQTLTLDLPSNVEDDTNVVPQDGKDVVDEKEDDVKPTDTSKQVEVTPSETPENVSSEPTSQPQDEQAGDDKSTAVQPEDKQPSPTPEVVEPTGSDNENDKTDPQSDEPVFIEVDQQFEYDYSQDSFEAVMQTPKRMFKAGLLRGTKSLSDQQVGDTAERTGVISHAGGSFVWHSIPGYNTANAAVYELTDSKGDSHVAYCIDAHLPNGVGRTSTYNGNKFSGIGAAALYGYTNGDVAHISIRGSAGGYTARVLNAYGIWVDKDVPAVNYSTTLDAGDIRMALRWLAWTNNTPPYSDTPAKTPYNSTVWSDFANMIDQAVPKIYIASYSTTFTYEVVSGTYVDKEGRSYVAGKTFTHGSYNEEFTSEPVEEVDTTHNYDASGPMLDIGDGCSIRIAKRRTVIKCDLLTPHNYRSKITNAQLENAYYGIINKMVWAAYNATVNFANGYLGKVGNIWESGNDVQRFVTFDYIEQNLELQVKKTSSNPTITDGNKMYSLKGIKYDIYVEGVKYGTVTLDENGDSEVFEFPTDAISDVIGKKCVAKEVDDATRKKSGYALGRDGEITLQSGSEPNVITVSDPPLNDPPPLTLEKRDAETDTSYDKLGI